MSRLFISHSHSDNREAIAVKAWLVEQEPGLADEIYLDVDPHTGIRPGTRWKEALQQANARCEAVICLLSRNWEGSPECQTEFRYAETLNKAILVVRLEPLSDNNITSEWQRCDLFVADGPTTTITVDRGKPMHFATEGLQRLLNGLRALGIGAQHFPWPPPGDPERAPYRGWVPLDEADAAVFFGRDAQIVHGLDVLRGMRSTGVQSLLVILGPSGAGKSSFLRAGLLPRLRRDDRQFLPMGIIRPERAVLTGQLGLAHSIYELRSTLDLKRPMLGEIKKACLTSDVEQLQSWLEEARHAARGRLLYVPGGQPAPTLVLPVDQAEELFNADAGPEAARFLEVLAALVEHQTGVTPSVVAAMTIRADRYEPLQTTSQLAEVRSVVFDDLKPMPPAGFKDVITGPAGRASAADRRLVVEPALSDRLLAETAEGADALPLLALTLERLYRDFAADGDLTLSEYESMGGMAQIVQSEVDKLLAAEPGEREAQLGVLHDAFVPWLATINPDNDQPMRRLARYGDLPAASHPLIDAFVENRLLVKDIRDGQTVVEVALESLLRQWHELAAWLRDEAQDLKAADALERAAADWEANGRNDSWLLGGNRLAAAETLAARPGFRDLLDRTRDYLHTSRAQENERIEAEQRRQQAELQAAKDHAAALRRRSRILVTVLAITAIVAATAVIFGVQANRARNEADRRFREATSLRLVSDAQAKLSGAGVKDDVRALQQLVVARRLAPTFNDGPVLNALYERFTTVKIADAGASVTSVAFSSDGQLVASGTADGAVQVWDADTGRPHIEPIHIGTVHSVAFSPDGRHIAAGGADDSIRFWDADTGQPVGPTLTGHPGGVHSVAFSRDGHRLASVGIRDKTVRVWNVDTGKELGALVNVDQVTSIAFSPDGHRIASGGNGMQVWNADTGAPIGAPLVYSYAVTSVAFSPDGHRIASGGDGVRMWNADTGQSLGTVPFEQTGGVTSVAFSPDGHRIATAGSDDMVRLWDANTDRPVGIPLTGHADWVSSVAFSPDGHRIASGGSDRTMRLWDADIGVVLNTPLTGHKDWVSSVAFSPDSRRITSGGVDGTVRLWDATSGRLIGIPLDAHTGPVTSVAFSPDARRIAAGGVDDTVRLWDADTGQPIGHLMTGHTDTVTSVAFSPDGHRVASASIDRTVRLWDADTGQPIGQPLTGHTDMVTSVAFSPDGHRVASASDDKTVRLWNADTGQPIGQPLTGHTAAVKSVAFSPDGHRIASASDDKTVRLWNADTGQPVGQPLTATNNPVFSMAFSPDGHRVAAGNGDGSVWLWDAATGDPLGDPLNGHTGTVFSVAFSPDGTRIATGNDDGTLRLWPAYPDPVSAICAKLTTNMSNKQWRDWVSRDIEYETGCPGLDQAPD